MSIVEGLIVGGIVLWLVRGRRLAGLRERLLGLPPWELPSGRVEDWPPLRLDERLDELAAQDVPPLRAPPDPEG